jgi:hypothetical protein
MSPRFRYRIPLARMAAVALALAGVVALATPARAVVHNVVLGAPYAAASFMGATTAWSYSGSGSWHKTYPGPKAELYIDPAVTFGTSISVDDIASITYHTRNHANVVPVEYYMAVYTKGPGSPPYAHGWYEQRLNAEPYLKTVQPYTPVYDVWNEWTTGGSDPLTFTDHNNAGNAGFYGAPTLADLHAGAITWSTWPGNPTGGSASATPIDYGSQDVLYLSFQTGTGWAAFDGQLDAITVALTNGDSYVIDLELISEPFYVDDDWAGTGVGMQVAPGKWFGYNAFAKIQDAVSFISPGGIIHVAAGTYTEQVVVDGKNVSILGAGRAATTILSPALLTASFTTSAVNKPVVFVKNTGYVEIRDLTVDANGAGNANNRIQGVAYWNAGGQLMDCDVVRVRNTPFDGVQAGVGVFGGTNTVGYALEVGGTNIVDFQKNGTVFTGTGYTVNMHDCTVTGAGPTGITAQNGIQFSGGAGGTVTNCDVSGAYYTGASFTATGHLFYAGTTVDVSDGTVTGCQSGTYYIDTNGQMSDMETNTPFGGGIGAWGVVAYNSSTTLAHEARTGGGPARPLPQPYDESGAASRSPEHATASLVTVTLEGGCLTGPGTAGSEGVEAYTEGGGLAVNVTEMEITNWGYGILADGTSGGPAVDANHNAITGNLTAGYQGGLGTHSAEDNWWGNAGGPGVGGANPVVGTVDATPWLIAGTDLAPGCGFLAPPDNSVTPVPPVTCVTPANPCVAVPVDISRTNSTGMRAFSVGIQLSAGLTLCAPVDEGTYLSSIGLTQFQVLNNGGGSYTIDAAILGVPCGATAATGTLFTLHVGSLLPSATGTVSVTSVILRDCANAPIAGSPGAAASVTIDNTAPANIAALAASQQLTGNDADGTTKVNLSWPAVEAGASVEVWRKGFGSHPEYDDGTGSAPPPPVGYPPAGWTLAGTVTGPTTFADETTARDFYYYVAYVKDPCGNVSLVSNRTNGTLNYHLGDVQPVALLRGNNLVNTSDMSDLGFNYGVSLVFNDPLNYLDVGPTTDFSTSARPTTDNVVQFEDLMMFAINYGVVSGPGLAARPAGKEGPDEVEIAVPELPAVGQTFAVGLRLSTPGTVKGVSAQLAFDPAIVEPAGVEAGELLAAQHVPSVVLSSGPGNVDAVVLGEGQTVRGSGVLARALFRVRANGDAAIRLSGVIARDRDNRKLELGVRSGGVAAGLPARTSLGPVFPNPIREEATIELSLREEASVSLDVFDLTGRRVGTILDGVQPAGVRLVRWDGRGSHGAGLAPGIYILRLQAGDLRQSRRVMLVH